MARAPADVVVVGDALNTLGLEAFNTMAGLGLNTRGFLWPCSGIWIPSDDPSLTTTWTTPAGPVTNTEVCSE